MELVLLLGKKDWSAVLIAVKDAPNTYDVRVQGNSTRVTVLSEDEIKAEGDKLKEPLYYIRKIIRYKQEE